MGTSSLSVGKGVGPFGAWLDDVWRGVLVWRIKPTRASMRKKVFWRVSRALNSDCQVQRLVYERHPGSCGLLCFFTSLLSLTLDSFGPPVILSSLSSLTPTNNVSDQQVFDSWQDLNFAPESAGQLYTIPFSKSATTGQHIPASFPLHAASCVV